MRVLILSISGLFLTANSDPDAAQPILDTANTPAPVAPKIDSIVSLSAQIVGISDQEDCRDRLFKADQSLSDEDDTPIPDLLIERPAEEMVVVELLKPAPTLTNELKAPIYAVHRVEAGCSVMAMMSGLERLRPLPQASGEPRLERIPTVGINTISATSPSVPRALRLAQPPDRDRREPQPYHQPNRATQAPR